MRKTLTCSGLFALAVPDTASKRDTVRNEASRPYDQCVSGLLGRKIEVSAQAVPLQFISFCVCWHCRIHQKERIHFSIVAGFIKSVTNKLIYY